MAADGQGAGGAAGGAWRHVPATTAGFAAVGASGLVLLAGAPRLVGPGAYSAVAFLWTAVNVFGLGLAQPAEQAVTRAVAARHPGPGAGPAPGGGAPGARAAAGGGAAAALLAGLAALVGAGLLAATSAGAVDALDGQPAAAAAGVLGLFAWAVLAPARGRVAGLLRMGPYAAALAVEAAVRVVLVAAAALVPEPARLGVLALAVSVPVAASLLPLLVALRRDRASAAAAGGPAPGPDGAGPGLRATARQLAGLAAVAGSNQVVLSSAALWLGATGALGRGTTGAFVTAATYLRAPTLLLGGLLAVSLSTQSALWASGRRPELRAAARRYWLVTTAYALLACAVLLAAAPWVLPVLYGGAVPLPAWLLAALAASSVAGMAAWAVAQSLVAVRRVRAAAVAWAAAAAAATAGFAAVGAGGEAALAAGLLAGPAVACAGQLLVWRSALPVPEPGPAEPGSAGAGSSATTTNSL